MDKVFFSEHLNCEITIRYIEFDVYFLMEDSIFYDFSKDDWPRMKNHMRDKKWFTTDMITYINQLLQC